MLTVLSLLAFGFNAAFGEGEQSLPPPLPPYAPGQAAPTPSPVADAIKEKADCKPEERVYGKIVCDCGTAKTKTIIKTVEKPVIKVVEKIKYVTKYVDRFVDRPVDRPVATERVVEKLVTKEVPTTVSRSSHTFGVLLGNGPDGVDLRLYGGEYQFMQKYGWVGGPMYQYTFANGFGLGAAYLTSDTWLGTGTYTFSLK
jgi:hypothetical protein